MFCQKYKSGIIIVYSIRGSIMIDWNIYEGLNQPAQILISLAIMLGAGFLVTRITKLLRLPNVSGYIIAGILVGPFVLNMVSKDITDGMSFISDIALAFIAFGVGKFFKMEVLKKAGIKVIIITMFESLLAMGLITISMIFIFKLDWKFSLLLGAIASATAPASTLMTIKQYKAEGHFVETLLQVVALDNIVCLLVFSVITSIASTSDTLRTIDIIKPILYNISMIVIGIALALLLRVILNKRRSKENRLIIVIMALLAISGVCSMFNVSPLLSCMVFATVYVNITDDTYLFHQIDNFTPPIMCLFFVLSGVNLNLNSLKTAGIISIAYLGIRLVGKYGGALAGTAIVKEPKSVKYNIGLALIPQASVAIGLSVLGARALPEADANLLSSIILASSVLYEFIGPACAKAALFLSGSIKNNSKEAVIEGGVVEIPTIDESKKVLGEADKS